MNMITIIKIIIKLKYVLSFQEKCLLMPMYEQPGSEIKTVIVNEDVVKKSAPAVYVYEDMELRQSSGV